MAYARSNANAARASNAGPGAAARTAVTSACTAEVVLTMPSIGSAHDGSSGGHC